MPVRRSSDGEVSLHSGHSWARDEAYGNKCLSACFLQFRCPCLGWISLLQFRCPCLGWMSLPCRSLLWPGGDATRGLAMLGSKRSLTLDSALQLVIFAEFNCADWNIRWIQLVVDVIMTSFSLARRLPSSSHWSSVEVQGSTKPVENVWFMAGLNGSDFGVRWIQLMCDLWLDSVYLDLYLSLDSMVLISAFAGFNLCVIYGWILFILDLYLLLDSVVLISCVRWIQTYVWFMAGFCLSRLIPFAGFNGSDISAFAGFNLCWFAVYFRVGCCPTTCGKGRLCQLDYYAFTVCNFRWIQLCWFQYSAGFNLWWISLHFCHRCMTLFSLARRLPSSSSLIIVEVQGSTKPVENVWFYGRIVLFRLIPFRILSLDSMVLILAFAGFNLCVIYGWFCLSRLIPFRWIQWFWFRRSPDSTYVGLWCIFVLAVVRLLVERAGFANWIIMLYCLQFTLDSTVLISIFAGFDLWWISLHFFPTLCCGVFVFRSPHPALILLLLLLPPPSHNNNNNNKHNKNTNTTS